MEPIESGGVQLTLSMIYHGPVAIRMLDASADFKDALGEWIGRVGLPRDVSLSPGDTLSYSGNYGGEAMNRLLTIDSDDVVASTCSLEAITDEGVTIEFPPSQAEEQTSNNNVEIRGAAFMLAMAAACPTNDNQLAIDAAQSIFDDAGYTDYAAADMFDTLKRSAESEDAGNPALACGLLEQALE